MLKRRRQSRVVTSGSTPRSASRSSHCDAAITLIETLVAIGIVAILLGIAVPSLSRARRAAVATDCLATLRSIVQGYHLAANQNGGYWANIVPPGAGSADIWHPGTSTVIGVSLFAQVEYWTGGLIGSYWEQGDGARMLACPHVYRDDPELFDQMAPFNAGAQSYFYSPAFFTDRRMWDPADEQARMVDPERWSKRVAVHEVAHPAAKVAMTERRDFHWSGIALEDPTCRGVNVAFADGHAERANPAKAQPALRYWPTPPASPIAESAVPFCAPAGGYLGRDY
ncbi:MAG: hypothetical protein IBJ10_05175 [Phycisphaerales bacterium]|nr:hypothetical protein [Phycisphaerales bacterium]